jgi:hypothetical protein
MHHTHGPLFCKYAVLITNVFYILRFYVCRALLDYILHFNCIAIHLILLLISNLILTHKR